MLATLVDLGPTVVNQEVSQILETYPEFPHQASFAVPELRQQLVLYVLNRLKGYYTLVNKNHPTPVEILCRDYPEDRRRQVQSLIHDGVSELIQDRHNWNYSHSSPTLDGYSPSNWFG